MKRTLRQKLDASRRRLMKRIDKTNWNGQSPTIGVVQQLVRQLDSQGHKKGANRC